MKVELPFDGYDMTDGDGNPLVITEPMKRIAERLLLSLALVNTPDANADIEWMISVDSEGRTKLLEYYGDSSAHTCHWRGPSMDAVVESFRTHCEGNFSGGWEDPGIYGDMKPDDEVYGKLEDK